MANGWPHVPGRSKFPLHGRSEGAARNPGADEEVGTTGKQREIMLALVASMCALAAPHAGAQRLGPEPKKKRSDFVSDTNNANALYDWGLRAIARDPSGAADAFYWAARLNPAYAEPLYGRRAALLLRDPVLIRATMTSGRKPNKSVQTLDSLLLRALSLNPFLFRRFDRQVLVAFIRESATHGPGGERVDGAELNYYIEQYLSSTRDVELKAWMAYADGDHDQALKLYASAIRSSKGRGDLHVERGRIFAMRGAADSAIAEFNAALTEMRAKDDKNLVVLYNSKAVIEHSICALLESKDDIAGAHEAYGRALQEDLSFYPSHVRLGLLTLTHGDTTAALSELETASQVAGDEPWVRYSYGFALASAGQADAAFAQLIKATELEPLYSRPYPIIAKIWERRGDATKAMAAYQAFLARASSDDPQRKLVDQSIENLKPFLTKGS